MVLYKRKRVTYVRPPAVPEDLSTEIYIIPQTKEWFLDYEAYLARTDYYNRRKFVCEITGNSCLTYYEAYESEAKEIQDLESNFPEALREHILKFLQFNRISRLDLLVDKVYLVFKNEYFPGEEVFVKKLVAPSAKTALANPGEEAPQLYISSVKQRGVIREKVQYSNPSDTKYLVSTLGDNSQIIATNQQISRDRNHFTKWLVKTYVKLTVTRSHKVGAPWVVKEKYAKKYLIPSEFPEDLKQFEHLTPTGEVLYEGDERADSPSPATDLAEVPKQKKPRGRAALKKKAALNAALNAATATEGTPVAETVPSAKVKEKSDGRQRFPAHHLPAQIREELEKNEQATTSLFQPSKKTIIEDLHLSFDMQNSRPTPCIMLLPPNAKTLNSQAAEPLEDELEELHNVKSEGITHKIALREEEVRVLRKDSLHSVQEALECWTFLNIYHLVLKLDTFTFDDFLCAMGWNDDQLKETGRCELLDEIWCAVLGLVVSNEPVLGKNSDDTKISGLQITLPSDVSLLEKSPKPKAELQDDDATKGSDSEHEPTPLKIEDDVSENESASPSPRKNKKAQSRPEDSKPETADADDEAEQSEDDEANADGEEEGGDEEEDNDANHGHNAYSVINYRGVKWHERLRKRNFKDGNWITIVMGVLSLVEYVPEYSETIKTVYQTLAPSQITPATPSTVLSQFYTFMSIDLRLNVLYILISLVVNGNAVRSYIDESLEASTILRRTRLDIIRDWKSHVETANKLHTEVFNKLMEEVSTTTNLKLWSSFTRKKHRLNTKGYEMTDYEKTVAETDPSFKELWDAREASIAKIRETRLAKKEVEMKLSQLDCQRVRLLGKDRHFNRYWWFENNGLPNIHYSGGGDEDEDQQEPESDDEVDEKDDFQTETYLMGCLWIQGPTGMDSLSRLKLTKDEIDRMISAVEEETQDKEVKLENGNSTNDEPSNQETSNGANSLKEVDFSCIPPAVIAQAEKIGLKFSRNTIEFLDSTKIIDEHGGLPKDFDVGSLSAVQRKLIEEQEVPLFSGSQWRYFDKPEDVDSLIKWLNPWGKRESGLRKEFLRVREGMTASIAARRQALWLDKLPKEELELEENIEAVEMRIAKYRNGEIDELEAEESGGDDVGPRKRPNRRVANGANKRQKTAGETIKSGSLQELEQLQSELKEKLAVKVLENQITRVTEWVNRTARDEFDKSLYEGGDKAKPRGRKGKK